METVIASDIYYKQIDTFAFPWTLYNIATY